DVSDQTIAVNGGAIDIRIYRPESAEALPLLVYAHGGGFVFCDLDSHDGLCRSISNLLPGVVVSVSYRLAPENRWPAAAEDVYAVTKWVADNAEALGDADRLAVGGDSAGGNLAAVTALMARDRGGPPIAAQLLLYPITNDDLNTSSYLEFAADYMLTREAMTWYWDQYEPKRSVRRIPYASPLRADD